MSSSAREKVTKNLKPLLAGVLVFVASGVAGCSGLESQQVREQKYGKEVPVVTQSYAAPQIYPGETWKVYLSASDTDGDMRYIVSTIFQPGVGEYSPSYTRLAERHRQQFSGYIYLNTASPFNLHLVNLTLTVQIQDFAGHYSKPVNFPLSFNYRYRQEPTPPGMFPENNLGPIMIQLRTIDEGDRLFDRPWSR